MNVIHFRSMISSKTCFIASTIGEENSEERKNADEKFDLVFEPVLDDLGYKAVRADKIGTPNSISNDIVKALLESELMIADVSDLNPNVFYELAVRNAIQKPVIVIRGKSQKMPFDIYDKRSILLDMKDARLWTEAKELLKKQIIQSEKDKKSASESILSNFSLKTDLESKITPSDEISLELKDLKSEVRRLREDVREKDEPSDTDRFFFEKRILSKDRTEREIFMDILKNLEGKQKIPISEQHLITEYSKATGTSFANGHRMLRKLLRDTSIYESRPGYYNRV